MYRGKKEERKDNKTNEVINDQLESAIEGLSDEQMEKVIVAYEPVWAIGTGKVATPEQAEEVHSSLRGELLKIGGDSFAKQTPILYGGSVKPESSKQLFAQSNVNGFLVGGASLKPESFFGIFSNAKGESL